MGGGVADSRYLQRASVPFRCVEGLPGEALRAQGRLCSPHARGGGSRAATAALSLNRVDVVPFFYSTSISTTLYEAKGLQVGYYVFTE